MNHFLLSVTFVQNLLDNLNKMTHFECVLNICKIKHSVRVQSIVQAPIDPLAAFLDLLLPETSAQGRTVLQ